jgi:hypothetical protein
MNREIHVRICGRLGAKFPGPTRPRGAIPRAYSAVADLQTHRDWQIDQAAAQRYRQAAAPDNRLIVLPEAYSFSPDDTKVLIGMDLVDLSVATAQEAAQVSNLYKKWWFVVDTSSGRVLREYRTVEIPKRWYLG